MDPCKRLYCQALLDAQRKFFRTGATLPVAYRKAALRRLAGAIDHYEQAICDALKADLGKSPSESYMCEVGLVKSEISFMLRHMGAYAREKRVRTPLSLCVSRSFVKPSPYGSVLIMSPWNYPFLLTIAPLVDALAAGNTAVLKPSAYSPHVTQVIQRLISHCFDPEYVAVVTGGRAENACLTALDFDYIFFTGSQAVGKMVMAAAAEHLTPVTLELGGKSPCIVDASADLPDAARHIVFGKLVNCGQTCVAPDYVYCHASVKDRLVEEIKKQISAQYGPNPLDNGSYGKMISQKHFERVVGLIDPDKTVVGGERDAAALRIAPTVLDHVTWDDKVMGEEIFGPVLPILTWESVDQALSTLQALPSPLALYIFSKSKKNIELFKSRLSFGGGCVNDVVIHLATSAMGFGGVGASGMGAYHGRRGFDTFSHHKSMVDRKTWLDLPIRYQPYTKWKDALVRMFVK